MKRIIIIFIILCISVIAHCQDKVYIDAPYIGLPMRQTSTKRVDSLKQLPARIPFIINQLFKISMTDFVNSIVFMKGQIIDIESWAAKDSTFQVEYNFVIPKYELYFELRDTTINIKRYCFHISLDQYGQIIRFDWPREGFNKRTDFISGIVLKKEAVKYASSKKYKTKECLYELVFDECNQRLRWHISFLQESTGDKFDYLKEYKTIVFDALSKDVIEEMGMSSAGISD